MTPKPRWLAIADQLDADAVGPTASQLRLAEQLRVTLPAVPSGVAAEFLRHELSEPLQLSPQANGQDLDRLNELERELGMTETSALLMDTRDELSARFRAAYATMTSRGLRALKPTAGDILKTVSPAPPFEGIVSSISVDGKVNFRGWPARRVWPNYLEVSARVGDGNYEAESQRIDADGRNRPGRFTFSQEATRDLEQYKVSSRQPSDEAVRRLEGLLATERLEGPFQEVIEQYPELLAGVVFGHWATYVIPQVRFGSHYVADFLVLGLNSAGAEWVMVELEAPEHALHLTNRDRLAGEVRHGVDQIRDWRNWLTVHVADAQRKRSDGGLGLHGITNQERGLLIIGRGEVATDRDVARRTVEQESRVEIRTYDWLLRDALALADNGRHHSDLSIRN